MRKAQKKQADRILELLEQVHKGIRQTIQAGQKAEAADYLSQCQDAAISLGEFIEQTEGEGFVTVTFLEEYCEIVYQIYEKLQQGQEIPAEKSYKHLHKALVKIKNSVNHDIKLRMEAVFLPYKASMWDSLESVWKAADEDPDCDAYVIPIPYYDKNPDGTFREVHCEENLYPDYVPVTHYEDYDFAEHHPDMIFIHNPYDDCNYVTSVHPFFYSRNLKQYTEKSVYIPYFILGEVDPENAAAVKGIEHFCTVPAVLHADKVIVQSEDMRTVYVNVMTEFAKENGLKGMDRKYWEEKILGLGSPKIDKVLNTRKEDLQIPEEWLRIIEKPDGSWKKIIFYNTTVSALLQHSEKYLEKMKDVFRVFYENKDEVALLWRPHPLMEATVNSMRSELAEEYGRIVREYKDAGWGIYDDSADLDRAVAVCDGYYGDGSSVIKLCQKAGEAVLIQNCEIRSSDKSMKISLEDFIVEEQKIIFPVWDYDQICIYDIDKRITKNIRNYKISKKERAHLYSRVCKFNEHEYLFTPLYSDSILLYDSLKQKFDTIKLRNTEQDVSDLFFETILYRKNIYLIPGKYNAIVKFNCENRQVTYYKKWIDILNEKRKKSRFEIFSKHGFGLLGDELYLAYKYTSYILKIDLNTEQTEIIEIDDKYGTCETICGDRKFCWITTSKNYLIRLNSEKSIKYISKEEMKLQIDNLSSFSEMVDYKNKLYLIPWSERKIIEIDKISFATKVIEIKEGKNADGGLICFCAKAYKNALYMYSFGLKKMFVLDLKNYKINSFHIYEDFSDESVKGQIRQIENYYDPYEQIYKEDHGETLIKFFLGVLQKIEDKEKTDVRGILIWKKINEFIG